VKRCLQIAAVFCCLALNAQAQAIKGLPIGAVVIETRTLVLPNRPNRVLVLWMLKPKRNPLDPNDELYTCPDETRGSYYSGRTRVSLYDPTSRTIINTLKVTPESEDNADSFDLPYSIRKGYYYRVEKAGSPTIGAKPTIMWLEDYNGDGSALEFALFNALACMGLETALFGYSERQDKLIQYPITLRVVENGRTTTQTQRWADYLLSKTPQSPGHWKYEVDYRGRGGSLEKWEVKYDRLKESFEGTLTRSTDEF
jgi:hypothetical protein